MNPYRPPRETTDHSAVELPLKPISARELFGLWVLMVVLPTMAVILLVAVS